MKHTNLRRIFAIATIFTLTTSLASAEDILLFSNEVDEQNANTTILDFDDTGGDVILQFGNTLGEQLYWDDANSRFVFTDDLEVAGDIIVSGTVDGVDIDVAIGNRTYTNDFQVTDGESLTSSVDSLDTSIGDRTYTADNFVTDGESVAESIDALDQAVAATANNTGTTSNTFTIDSDDTGGDVILQFGTALSEQLYWNDALSRFELTDDLNITGDITLTGTVDGVDVSALNTTVTGHLDGGANKHDASEIDVETAGNITTLADLETNLGAFDTAFGNRTYTEDNYVTDGESLTASIDALDQAIDDVGDQTNTKSIFINMNDFTVQEDGTNNSANLYSGSDAGVNPHQYYTVRTYQTILNDLDVVLKVQLPLDFEDFSNTDDITFSYRNTGADVTDSAIDISVEDEDGDAAWAAGGTGLFNLAWTDYLDEFDAGAFDPQAGEFIYVTLKGYASRDGITFQQPYMGEVVIQYTGNLD